MKDFEVELDEFKDGYSTFLSDLSLEDEEGRVVEKANPGNRLFLFTEPVLVEAEVNAILRRKKEQLQQVVL